VTVIRNYLYDDTEYSWWLTWISDNQLNLSAREKIFSHSHGFVFNARSKRSRYINRKLVLKHQQWFFYYVLTYLSLLPLLIYICNANVSSTDMITITGDRWKDQIKKFWFLLQNLAWSKYSKLIVLLLLYTLFTDVVRFIASYRVNYETLVSHVSIQEHW
jgi:hypothetical protein